MSHTFLLSVRQWCLLLALLAGAIYGTEKLVQHERQHDRSQQLRNEIASAGQLRALIESELNIPLYLTLGLTAYVQANDGNISAAEMHMLLPELVHQARHIRNIGVAPDNTLRYVYPLSGNEKVVGLYYPDLAAQWPVIATIIAQREARLVGPIALVQGGTAFIYRLPVYINANDYWGIISTVVDIDSVWALLEKQTSEQEVQVAIRSLSLQDRPSTAFYGDNSLFYDDSLLLGISLRGASWQMAVRSLAPPADRSMQIRATAYGVTALLAALLIWLLLSRQHLRNSLAAQECSKQYLRSIMDNVNDAIITTDPDGTIEQVNLSCYPMFGYKSASLPGHHWSELLAEPQQLDELYSATSSAKTEFQTLGRRRDNSLFPIAVNRSNVQLQQQPKQLLVLRDLSEHQQTEQLKQQFISTVSHELRTPLASIASVLGLAASGALGEMSASQQRMLQLAHNNCQQLTALVNELLNIEKISSGTMMPQLQPLALLPLLRHCIDETQLLHPELNLQLDCPASLSQVIVNADAIHVQQVVQHLLSNAVKFSPAHATIQVVVSRVAQRVRVMVQDQGEGVAEHFVPLLFSRFSQADSSDGHNHAGTGLGLAISHNLIRQMQGAMGYTPAPGHGSCFYFDLPYIAALQAGSAG
jgi:two-component system, OmpR family, sensor histidine kinase VicK